MQNESGSKTGHYLTSTTACDVVSLPADITPIPHTVRQGDRAAMISETMSSLFAAFTIPCKDLLAGINSLTDTQRYERYYERKAGR